VASLASSMGRFGCAEVCDGDDDDTAGLVDGVPYRRRSLRAVKLPAIAVSLA